ncbi:MAG: adenylosuccinate lyase [Halobacteriovorax sp.]|nr:adenylosuccinate lyase [Halobacteriovorax sp.]
MIERYEKTEISQLWNEDHKFKKYLDVEIALIKALEKRGLVEKDLSKMFSKAKIDPQRIKEIEKETRHDVIAFCTSITEQFESEKSRFFHFGVTSSDIIDTATNLQIKESLEVIIPKFEQLVKTLESRAHEYKDQLCIGRSHGIYAEPMSFGVKLLGHAAEFSRRLKDLKDFYYHEMTGQMSGAVGNYTILTPEIEEDILNELGLKVESVSTQVIPRDRHAKLISIFSLYACALERLCIEIRHLQHSDIAEVFEGFAKGQKGSSTMPHKKNPISSENLTGMARVMRSHMSMAMENCLLWHERDISHSSSERMYLPDALGIMYYSIERMNSTVRDLVVNTEHMESKVTKNFKHLSSFLLHELIKCSTRSREELYTIVQNATFEATSFEGLFDHILNSVEQETEIEHMSKLRSLDQKAIFAAHNDLVFERTIRAINN